MRLLAEQSKDCNFCESGRIKDSFKWEEFISTPQGVVRVGLNIFICEDCGFIFLNPQPSEELLEYYYRTDKKALIEGGSIRYREQQAGFIAQKIEGRGKAFDLGCFDGTLLHYLKAEGWEVAGCDLNEEAIEVSRSKYGIEIQKAGMGDVKLEDGSTDLLTLVHLLEHMEDPDEALRWCRRKLAERGHLYVMVPDAGRMFSNSIYGYFSFPHLNYFTMGSLKNYLRKNGFEIVSARATEGFEFLEVLARKADINEDVDIINDYGNASDLMGEYIKKRQRGLDDFTGYFLENKKRWVEERYRVVLWGAGLHTSIVFSHLPLAAGALDLVGIIDKDESLRGSEACGLTVYPPDELDSLKPDVVLVSSYWYAQEIGRELREDMAFKGEIFYFYGEPTKGHPIARDY